MTRRSKRTAPGIDSQTIRAGAVLSLVDERTFAAAYRGERVRNASLERIRDAAKQLGINPPPEQAK